jgi:GNAT superfamily N-acetyltransferase
MTGTKPRFSAHGSTKIVLRDGAPVWVRGVKRSDARGLQQAFTRLSDGSRYRRFRTGMAFLGDRLARYFADVDHVDHEALVALPTPQSGVIIGVARFIRHQPGSCEADLAITVADQWQGRGLATALLALLSQRARAEGIRRLTVDTLTENTAVLALVRAAGGQCNEPDGGAVTGYIDL